MTKEEAIRIFQEDINWAKENRYPYIGKSKVKALEMAIKALEQEPKTGQFAKWVATEIFDENWEYNKEAFAELACRKLAKLGIVIRMGDEWELVESLGRNDEE